MIIRYLVIVIFFVLVGSTTTNAQSWRFMKHELSFGIGGSNFMGELGGADRVGSNRLASVRDFEISMTRPTVTVGYRHIFTPNYTVKGNLIYGRLRGDDAFTNELFRNNRNLHFRSPLIELSAQFEWFPFGRGNTGYNYRMSGIARKGSRKPTLSPYLFAGIGGFWFNPKGKYLDGNWYALQPLGTEGQTVEGSGLKPYSRISVCIPMGIGLLYEIDKQWSVGLELTIRMTFTDYIDDVSGVYYDNEAIKQANGSMGEIAAYFADPSLRNPETFTSNGGPTRPGEMRGNDSENDAYVFAIFSLNYKLVKRRRFLPKF
jgi:hypothetical protein